MKLRHFNAFLHFRLLFHEPHCRQIYTEFPLAANLGVAGDIAADVSDWERSGNADARVGSDDATVGSFASNVSHLNAQTTNYIGSQQTVAPLGNFPPVGVKGRGM